jgi:glycine oxidase
MRIVIVGGGVMGCATALELASRGAKVTVLERAIPGAEASSAAAGILGAELESAHHGPNPEWMAARDDYAAWARELEERSQIHVGYKKCGALLVAFTEEEARALKGSTIDGARAREIEPALSPRVISALHFPDEAQVDPPLLLRALVVAASRAGVEMRAGTTVRSLAIEGQRCTGVELEQGRLAADVVVLAAGSWSSLVWAPPSEKERVRPVRGQIVQLDERPPSLRGIVFGAGGYVVARGDGRVLCGSTMENVGFRREVTAAGVHHVLGAALAIAPSLSDAQLGATWSNFRPFAERPLVGKSEIEGLYLATGHHRNGILLAHATAMRVADSIFGVPERVKA